MTYKHTYDDNNLCFECDKENPLTIEKRMLLAFEQLDVRMIDTWSLANSLWVN